MIEQAELEVRRATPADLPALMDIYSRARRFMVSVGNPSQWTGGYPSEAVVAADIRRGCSYVVTSLEHGIVGAFSFPEGVEPNYASIDGQWLSDAPYGTIHRIASAGKVRGIADRCLDFCLGRGLDIRIDTHADNRPMLAWIASRGFEYCGIIRVEDGSPRKAFVRQALLTCRDGRRAEGRGS